MVYRDVIKKDIDVINRLEKVLAPVGSKPTVEKICLSASVCWI